MAPLPLPHPHSRELGPSSRAAQREGGVEFRPAWYHPLDEKDHASLAFEHGDSWHLLPRPVVMDLNGDGSPEVLAMGDALKSCIAEPDGVAPAGPDASG